MMSGIRGRNTRPELLIRKGLFALGFRYRLHAAGLPGKPDIVLRKYNTVIFVNGCFWHGHDCHLFRLPSTRPEFWRTKIASNITRDEAVHESLHQLGWRQLNVWECALKGKTRLGLEAVLETIIQWLNGDEAVGDIRGIA
jgi:DNA mismatch endonuclease (patch repair protein)